MTPVAESRIRVRYAETDQMGVVYYANYLVWMEVGRVDLCRACGFEYRDMERDDGILLAVAEANCRYVSAARFDDEVTVRTAVGAAHRRAVTFTYEMRVGPRKVAEGYTKHLILDRNFQRTQLPAKYWPMFGLT
jgi:acyl-CoA thioester hydrolase